MHIDVYGDNYTISALFFKGHHILQFYTILFPVTIKFGNVKSNSLLITFKTLL